MFEAIVLGIIQGLTEFLPVSSTAHLVLVPSLFGWKDGLVDSLAFDVALHAGTLVSVLICLRREIVSILTKERRLVWVIALGTIPAGAAGVLLKHQVETVFRGPWVIAAMLVLFGVVMYAADRMAGRRELTSVGAYDAVFVGIAQAVALIPGVSRSGVTVSAGLARGMTRDGAARFSFLLSIPVILGALLLEGRKLFAAAAPADKAVVAAGFIASLVTGVIAIEFMLGWLRKHSLNAFVAYRFILAGVIALWLLLGV